MYAQVTRTFSDEQMAEHDARAIGEFVSAIIQCVKAVDPTIGKYRNCLSIYEMKAFNAEVKAHGIASIKRHANYMRQTNQGKTA